ncbi:hypothetical protein CEXT_805151 [Caerostris extrusa]|uniref:Uncharacterized protein n=1 Tax=Caerostris extrusa TaxID=172846 RepID=A0AAV4Q3E9_CAEEX|nr:hypothetical protein CEXT_805151 [Caerostris extrusa]
MQQIAVEEDFMGLHDFGLQVHLHSCQFELTQSEKRWGGKSTSKLFYSPYFPPPFAATVSGEEKTINSSPTPRCEERGGNRRPNYSNSPYFPPPFAATSSLEREDHKFGVPLPDVSVRRRLLQNELCHHLVLHSSAEWMISTTLKGLMDGPSLKKIPEIVMGRASSYDFSRCLYGDD